VAQAHFYSYCHFWQTHSKHELKFLGGVADDQICFKFSYRASSIHVTIRITNRCDFLFYVFISFFSSFTPHVSGFHKPIIRGISSCCLYATIWFMRIFVDHLRVPADWYVVVSSLYSVYVIPFSQYSEDTTTNQSAGARRWSTKTCMNQMVAYKQQLEIPLIMGLWKPETCRVKDEKNGNKDIKQKVTSVDNSYCNMIKFISAYHDILILKRKEKPTLDSFFSKRHSIESDQPSTSSGREHIITRHLLHFLFLRVCRNIIFYQFFQVM
jgi:hypothetical protein